MTNESIILPDAPACAIIMRDTIIAACASMTRDAARIADPILDPFSIMTDSDDYARASASIIASLTFACFDSDSDNARDALSNLIADPEFMIDLETCDFNSPLANLLFPIDD